MQSLLPDGLLHHKYTPRKSGTGTYVLCRKEAFEQFILISKYFSFQFRKSFLRLCLERPRRSAPNVTVHPLLAKQIGHQLRVRVLQELELLTRKAKRTLKTPHSAVLRRLTRAEWKEFKSTGIIPHPGAVALLVVPPLNKNPVTKQRPVANASTAPEDQVSDGNSKVLRPLPPLSTMHPVSDEQLEEFAVPDLTPPSSVPMYNGLALFPSRSQRAALHERLCGLLRVERVSQRLHTNLPHYGEKAEKGKGDGKFSHAFLLCSDPTTVQRGDSVPLAIALWRVRMWEGGGWDGGSGN